MCGSAAFYLVNLLKGFTKTDRDGAKGFSYPAFPFQATGLILFSGQLKVAAWLSCQWKNWALDVLKNCSGSGSY